MLTMVRVVPIATLFPPATLSAIQSPVAGTVQVLMPSIMDGTGANEMSAYLNLADADDGPSSLLGNLLDKVYRGGLLLQPLAVANAVDYSYPLTIHLPLYECSSPRSRSDVPEWDVPAVDALARQMWTPQFNSTILQSLQTNSTFGLFCGRCAEDHWLRNRQIMFIAVADSTPEYYGAANSPNPPLPFRSVGFENNTMGPDPCTRGNISFAAYDLFLEEVFVTDCQLYNTSVNLNVSVTGRNSTVQVMSKKNIGVIDLSLWFPEAERANPNWPSYSAYQATKRWVNLMYGLILGGNPVGEPRRPWGSDLSGTVFERTKEYAQYNDHLFHDDEPELWDRTARPALGEVIEELSLNFSLSLMSDGAFSCVVPRSSIRMNFTDNICSRRVNVPTNFSGTDLRYLYEPANLLWSYGSIIIGTAVVVVLGMWAFVQNGTSHDNLISSFGAVLQNPEVCRTTLNISRTMNENADVLNSWKTCLRGILLGLRRWTRACSRGR